jgi:hypothetical protein
MSDSAKRKMKYRCVVCENPSFQLKTEVDFGQYGKRKISVCGRCLRLAERGTIFTFVTMDIDPLKPFLPFYIVETVMGELLDKFRKISREGS